MIDIVITSLFYFYTLQVYWYLKEELVNVLIIIFIK